MQSSTASPWFPLCLLFCLQAIIAQESAPAFTGMDMRSGKLIALDDYRGKVIFLDFWASWCPPCIASLPAYEEMNQEIDSEEFALLAINMDEDVVDGMLFLEDAKITYPVISDPEGKWGIPSGVSSLPASYLINRNGMIVERIRGFDPGLEEEIKDKIYALLGKRESIVHETHP